MDNETKQSNLGRWLLIGLFVAVVAGFYLLGGDQWLNLETAKSYRNEWLGYTQTHFVTMLLACGLVYTLSTAFSLPGASFLSLLLGFLFGRWVGAMLIVVSATLGATLVFWAARYIFAAAARRRLEQNAVSKKLIAGFSDNAFNYLLFLRLVPLFPFWLVNLVPAFTGIKTRTYAAATFIGIIPGSFVFANLGQSLGQVEQISDLVSVEVLLGFSLLGVFALIPVFFKGRISNEEPAS